MGTKVFLTDLGEGKGELAGQRCAAIHNFGYSDQ